MTVSLIPSSKAAWALSGEPGEAKKEIHEVRGLPVEFVAQRRVSGETPGC
jgi:hypothetical protein